MDSFELLLGVERMGRDGKYRGKIFKMDIGSGFEDARLYGKGRITKREAESKGGMRT